VALDIVVQCRKVNEAIEKGLITASKRLTAAEESLILASIPKLATGWRAATGWPPRRRRRARRRH
jgi:hypothetical protein